MTSFMHNPGNASHENVEDPYNFIILDQGEEHNAYIPIGRGNREGKQNAAFVVTKGDEEEYSFDSSDFSEKDGNEMVGLDFDLEGGNNNDSPEVDDKKISKPVTGLDRGTGLPKKYEGTEGDKEGGVSLLPLELESSERQQAVSSTIYRSSDRNDEDMPIFKDRDDQLVWENAKHDHDKSVKKMEYESSNMITSDMKVTTMDNFSLREEEEDHLLSTMTENNNHITPAAVLGVSLSTPPSTIFQMGVNKDDMEENDDYSNEEFEEDQEDSNIKGDFVGDMQSNTPIQLREDLQDRSSNKCESDYGGAEASFEEESGSVGGCMTGDNESDYADESSFEEDSESINSVITCEESDQKENGKIFNEEMTTANKSFTLPSHSHKHASPISTGRGITCIPHQPPPTLASKDVETITTRSSTASSYTVVIDRSEQQYNEDTPALLENIPIKAQAPTEATLHYDFDPVKKIYRRSCGTQFSNNTAAVQANIPSIGMIGVTSSLDRHSTRHSRFLPGRGGGPYIGRFASDHPPLVPSLPNPSIWAMPPNPPPYIPFYPSTTHVENLGSATNSASSSELKQLANNVLNAAPTTHANEITSMEEAGRVTAAGPRLSIAMDDCPTPLAVSEAAFRRQLKLLRDNLKLMKQRAEICTDIPFEQYSLVPTLMGTQHDITMARREALGMDEALKRIDLAY